MIKTVRVTPGGFDAAVQEWTLRGFDLAGRGDGWVILRRPQRPYRPHFGKWTVRTLGLYPFLYLVWLLTLAWWVVPLIKWRRVHQVTVIRDLPDPQLPDNWWQQ